MAQPSFEPQGGKWAEGKKPLSTGTVPPMLPLPSKECCDKPVLPSSAEKPKINKNTGIHKTAKKQENAVLSLAPVCHKGCPEVGWTVDQFCEVCHSPGGSGSPVVWSPSPVPLGAGALGPPVPLSGPPVLELLYGIRKRRRCISALEEMAFVPWRAGPFHLTAPTATNNEAGCLVRRCAVLFVPRPPSPLPPPPPLLLRNL